MTSPGEIALRLQDQGWRGLLPLLPHNATPHVRLALDKVAEVEAGRGKAPGRWARAGWSLQPDWRTLPDDAGTVEGWAQWPGVNVGLRACHAAPWVAFIDVDVLHAEASSELMELLRRRLQHGEFIWRVGNAPKFLIPVQVTEPVRRNRSVVVEIDGQRHMVELLGQGQQAVIAGIHPKTGRVYFWPEGGLEETEPAKLPLLTPAELADVVSACSRILLRYGPAVGRKGRPIRAEFGAEPKPLAELRAYDPALARAAAEFVLNTDWSRDDWVAWAYALRGAFGNEGKELWLRFSAQSAKASNPATAEKVWHDATQAERDGHLRAGAGTVIAIAKQEGFTPPPSPGLPAYFEGGEQEPAQASAALRLAII
ncbi:MAG TPA: PriCT-2 domain-containing protein, partial [Gaiellales bacterium]|nr:PriCT-2 domain-containing protein [Gaiellales bacterium]